MISRSESEWSLQNAWKLVPQPRDLMMLLQLGHFVSAPIDTWRSSQARIQPVWKACPHVVTLMSRPALSSRQMEQVGRTITREPDIYVSIQSLKRQSVSSRGCIRMSWYWRLGTSSRASVAVAIRGVELGDPRFEGPFEKVVADRYVGLGGARP